MAFISLFEECKRTLGKRAQAFVDIFDYLDSIQNPSIIEVGPFQGELKQSTGTETRLFDCYAEDRGGKHLAVSPYYDICEVTKKNTVGTYVYNEHSVEFLAQLCGKIDCLYLNQYLTTSPSSTYLASLHLQELFAAKDLLQEGTLIIVEDHLSDKGWFEITKPTDLVDELMFAIGIKPFIDGSAGTMAWIYKELPQVKDVLD